MLLPPSLQDSRFLAAIEFHNKQLLPSHLMPRKLPSVLLFFVPMLIQKVARRNE
jgi:hypothetical protein